MHRTRIIAGALSIAGLLLPLHAFALTIDITYDSSVSSAPPAFKQDINEVIAFYESHFDDPITIDIDVGYGEVGGGALASGALGESEAGETAETYSAIYNAFVADETTATDTEAVTDDLSSTDPFNGTWYIATAEAEALGLLPGSEGEGGYAGFSSSYTMDYNRTDGITTGQYDFEGVVAHEFSEVMGRICFGGPTFYASLDLFRYKSSGVLASTTFGGYFSINDGATNLDTFNSNESGDECDWAGSAGNDSYLAFSSSGVQNSVTAADLTVMDTIGYDGGSFASSTILTVMSASSTPSTGAVAVGAPVQFAVTMSEPVKVVGSPTLTLNNGGTATYLNGSGTTTLNFSYTVPPGQSTSNLQVSAINLNGGTIQDGMTNNANLSLTGVSQSGPQIIGTTGTSIATPPAPSGLTATAVSSTTINLSWSPTYEKVIGFNVSGASISTYQVFRDGVQIATTTTNSYSDTGLSAATPYSYGIIAVDSAGNTSSAGTASATTQAAVDTTAPSTPTNLSALAISPTQVTVSWTASTDNVGVTGYKVFRGGVQVATTTATTYSDSGLTASTLYSYTASAFDAANNVSSQSSAATATTLSSVNSTPPSVSILSPSDGTTITNEKQVSISVSASDNVAVAQTNIYLDGALLTSCSAATCSYQLSVSRLSSGSHTITATAVDTSNLTSTTTVTVTN